VTKQTYRLVIGNLRHRDERREACSQGIPVGAILDRQSEAEGFTTCLRQGDEVQVLSYDLQELGELVGGAGH
jgi:hypothetical protein